MCVTEKSTGFKWRNGDWEYAQFETGRPILIEKLEPEPVADPTNPPRSGSCEETVELEKKEARRVERSGRRMAATMGAMSGTSSRPLTPRCARNAGDDGTDRVCC
jgi:hypothetical protein